MPASSGTDAEGAARRRRPKMTLARAAELQKMRSSAFGAPCEASLCHVRTAALHSPHAARRITKGETERMMDTVRTIRVAEAVKPCAFSP